MGSRIIVPLESNGVQVSIVYLLILGEIEEFGPQGCPILVIVGNHDDFCRPRFRHVLEVSLLQHT